MVPLWFLSAVLVFAIGFVSSAVPFLGSALAPLFLFFLIGADSSERPFREIFAEGFAPLLGGVLLGTYLFVDWYSVSSGANAGHGYLVWWGFIFAAIFWAEWLFRRSKWLTS